ncbi:hypothetical protein GW537_12080 [Piscirickettsia salmonis]|nr:hypothetical protein GW538_11940 [Piscirickettsia salmonis]QHS30632.1 hypothetical protein GW537_12080 [Piscirickettsia salmonis]
MESKFSSKDDFCQELLPQWNAILLEDTNKKRNKPSQMSTSEIMTIMIYFHKSNYRNFKMYYLHVIKGSRKRRYLGRYFAHPMMQNRRAKRDDYKPSAVRVTQRYVP